MQRASHALVEDGDVWLVDPLDAAGLDEELDALGTVAGIVVLADTHARHADRLAERHDVAIHVPACLPQDSHPVSGFDAPVQVFDEALADTGFELVWEKVRLWWQEGALYHPGRQTLVIPDTLMTGHLTLQDDRLEVLPFFRFSPPACATVYISQNCSIPARCQAVCRCSSRSRMRRSSSSNSWNPESRRVAAGAF